MTNITIQVRSNHFTPNNEGGKTATISMDSRRTLGKDNDKFAIIADLKRLSQAHPDCPNILVAVSIDGTCRDAMGIPMKESLKEPGAYVHSPSDAIDLLNKFA